MCLIVFQEIRQHDLNDILSDFFKYYVPLTI